MSVQSYADGEITKVNTRLTFLLDAKRKIELGFYTSGTDIAVRRMNDDLAWKFASAVRIQIADFIEQNLGHSKDKAAANRQGRQFTQVIHVVGEPTTVWRKHDSDAMLVFGEDKKDFQAGIKFEAPGAEVLFKDYLQPKALHIKNRFACAVRDVVKDALSQEVQRINASIANIDLLGTLKSLEVVRTQMRRAHAMNKI
jgi:hypothetical protein